MINVDNIIHLKSNSTPSDLIRFLAEFGNMLSGRELVNQYVATAKQEIAAWYSAHPGFNPADTIVPNGKFVKTQPEGVLNRDDMMQYSKDFGYDTDFLNKMIHDLTNNTQPIWELRTDFGHREPMNITR